jgi:hypothetical protein
MSQLLVRDLDEEVVDALKRSHLLSTPKKRSFKEALAAMPYFEDDALFDVR